MFDRLKEVKIGQPMVDLDGTPVTTGVAAVYSIDGGAESAVDAIALVGSRWVATIDAANTNGRFGDITWTKSGAITRTQTFQLHAKPMPVSLGIYENSAHPANGIVAGGTLIGVLGLPTDGVYYLTFGRVHETAKWWDLNATVWIADPKSKWTDGDVVLGMEPFGLGHYPTLGVGGAASLALPGDTIPNAVIQVRRQDLSVPAMSDPVVFEQRGTYYWDRFVVEPANTAIDSIESDIVENTAIAQLISNGSAAKVAAESANTKLSATWAAQVAKIASKLDIAVETEAHLLDEGDATALIAAITAAIGNTNVDQAVLVGAIRGDLERSSGKIVEILTALLALPDPPSASTNASAVRTNLAAELLRITNGLHADGTVSTDAASRTASKADVSGSGGGSSSKLTTTIDAVADETTLTLSEGSTSDGDYIGQNIIITQAGDATRFGSATIVGYTGSTKTVVLSEALNFTPAAGDAAEIAIATVSVAPTNTETLPASRTAALVPGGDDSLVSEEMKIRTTDSNVLVAVDFRQDMPASTQIAKTISVETSTSAVIATFDANGKSASLVRLTGVSVTPDDEPCEVTVIVKYEDGSNRTGTMPVIVS